MRSTYILGIVVMAMFILASVLMVIEIMQHVTRTY
jgi:hypothetical protein